MRVPLNATPHYIMFHAVHRTYTVITSTPERYKPRSGLRKGLRRGIGVWTPGLALWDYGSNLDFHD